MNHVRRLGIWGLALLLAVSLAVSGFAVVRISDLSGKITSLTQDVTKANSIGTTIEGMSLFGSSGAVTGTYAPGLVWHGNNGYVTENTGTATLTKGQASVVISYGLDVTPATVQLTPTSDVGQIRYWVSDKGTQTFTINVSSAATSDISFDWAAQR